MGVKPTVFRAPHQLRRDYARYDQLDLAGRAHDLFQRRMEPTNFQPTYFRALAGELTELLGSTDTADDQTRFELAFVLLQNMPDRYAVMRAAGLLAEVDRASVHDEGDVDRLRWLAARLLDKLDHAAPTDGVGFVVRKLNWSVNNECPMVCRGCNNPFVSRQLDRAEALTVVDRIVRHGTTHVTLSGGDPLLWEHLMTVIDALHGSGIKIALDTTGYTLDRRVMDRIAGKVALLRLPLDGSTQEIERFFRRSPDRNLQAKLVNSLDLCDEYGFDRVVVHTAVSRGNIDDLANLAEIVAEHPCVHEWVLLQWWARRAPRKLVEEMYVDNDLIEQRVARIRAEHPTLPLFYGSSRNRTMINFFIRCDGWVVTFAEGYCEEFIVGNMLDNEISDIVAAGAVDLTAVAAASGGGLSDL